jgi:hypothetical protein
MLATVQFFNPRQKKRNFPVAFVFIPALGPTQPSVLQWVPGALSPGVKRCRAVTLTTHPPSNAEVKNESQFLALYIYT